MHRVRLLQHHGIKPFIVFDGGPLPAKKGTENGRQARREESLTKGKALMAQGKASEAREHFIKSIDVTPQMAAQLMKVTIVVFQKTTNPDTLPKLSGTPCRICAIHLCTL